MKFSLIFLLCCLMATTFGQNLFYWPFTPYGSAQHPAAVSSRSGGRYWPRFYQQYANQPESFGDEFDDIADDEEVYGRNKYQIRGGVSSKRLPANKVNQKKIEDRFLFARPNLFSTSTPVAIVVSTTFGTTSTIVSTSTTSCIPKAMFNGQAVVGPPAVAAALSTNACRRKRDAQLVLEQIDPTSNLNQIETTNVADIEPAIHRVQRDIESSRELLMDYAQQQQQNDVALPRLGFSVLSNILFNSGAATSTVVVTIPTSFAFSTTVSTKTFSNLGPAQGANAGANPPNAGINCLPAGFFVC